MRITLFLISIVCFSFSLKSQNNEILNSYKIAFIGKDKETPYYTAILRGIKSNSKKLENDYSIHIEIIELTPDKKNTRTQNENLVEAFLQDIDGIIICPCRKEESGSILKLIQSHGIEIIFVEERVESIEPLLFIQPDEMQAGELLGKNILNELQSNSRVAILTSNEKNDLLNIRMIGLKNILGYKRIEKIAYSSPNYHNSIIAIKEAMREDTNHYIKAWVFLEDWPMQGILNFPWSSKKLPIASMLTSPTSYNAFEQGYVKHFIMHPYYDWGHLASQTMVDKLFKNITPSSPILTTAPILMRNDNIEKYKEKWQDWLN